MSCNSAPERGLSVFFHFIIDSGYIIFYIEFNRSMISQRTKRCLDRLRAEGKHIGRTKGSKNKSTKLSGKTDLIKTLLSQNISKTQIAKMLKVDYSTLYKFLKQQMV